MSDLPGYLEKLEGSLELVSPFLISIGIDPSILTVQNLIQIVFCRNPRSDQQSLGHCKSPGPGLSHHPLFTL